MTPASAAGKVTEGLASHWPCVTDSVVQDKWPRDGNKHPAYTSGGALHTLPAMSEPKLYLLRFVLISSTNPQQKFTRSKLHNQASAVSSTCNKLHNSLHEKSAAIREIVEFALVCVWLNGSVVSALGMTAVRIPGRATIPLGSNLGQVVYSHCLPSFSAPRNWGTKRGVFGA